MPVVLIYRDQLIPYSETFIPAQAEALTRYCPQYVGTSRLGNVAQLSPEPIILGEIVWPSRFWKVTYKLASYPPRRWLNKLSQYQPGLLHAHFGGDGGFAAALTRQLKIPLVVTCHGYDATWVTSPLRGQDLLTQPGSFFRALLLHKRDVAFQSAQQILAVSKFIRDQLVARGCPEHKLRVHYIGIDLTWFCPDQTVAREPIVLFIGRLVEKKGCAYLIQAMAQVQQTNPEATLVVIGDGPLRSQLEALAAQTLKRYQFLGQQPPEQVRHWLNRATLLGGPSIIADSGDAEGLGMVFAEAQAMHVPVVGFATGGIPEVVCHHQTGLLVPEKDVNALTQAILLLWAQPEQRQRFALAGRQHVEQKFDLRRNTQALEEIYDEVMARYQQADGA
ncbi:MAG: glycosyltransferase [Cyanobacteria bacterium P01_A01_bin.114]